MIIFTRVNRNNKYSLNNKKIIHIVNKFRNFILIYDDYDYDYYEYHEYKKFKDYYIKCTYFLNNLKSIRYFNYSGERHRENGPSYIQYYSNGKINYKEHYLNDKYYSYINYFLEVKKLV